MTRGISILEPTIFKTRSRSLSKHLRDKLENNLINIASDVV